MVVGKTVGLVEGEIVLVGGLLGMFAVKEQFEFVAVVAVGDKPGAGFLVEKSAEAVAVPVEIELVALVAVVAGVGPGQHSWEASGYQAGNIDYIAPFVHRPAGNLPGKKTASLPTEPEGLFPFLKEIVSGSDLVDYKPPGKYSSPSFLILIFWVRSNEVKAEGTLRIFLFLFF
jgi:hypothetical protein